jgi:hypothetical protein
MLSKKFTVTFAKHLFSLAGLFAILTPASSVSVRGSNLFDGVNNVHLGWQTPEQQKEVVDEMSRSGVNSVRVSLAPPYDRSIESLDLLSRKGLSILLVVELAWPNLVARDAAPRPGRGAIHAAVPLSHLDSDFFREQFGTLWREIERRHIGLLAIELGNEINWAAFNGDLALLPPHGRPRQSAPRSTALINRPAYLLGLKRYVAALTIVEQFRDTSVYNRDTKIISAGLASMSADFAADIGAEYIDTNETLDILKTYGLDSLVDGYGLHSYPEVKATPAQRNRELEALLSPCADGLRGHPCWLTEWGIAQPKLTCPSGESTRAPLIREMRERIATFAQQRRIAGAYYFAWHGEPKAYALWRCGELTESGKVLFSH